MASKHSIQINLVLNGQTEKLSVAIDGRVQRIDQLGIAPLNFALG